MPRTAWFIVLCGLATACVRNQIRITEHHIMRPTQSAPTLNDDLDFRSLVDGLEANLRHLRSKRDQNVTMTFGPVTLSRAEYVGSLEYLLTEARKDGTGGRFREALHRNFTAYVVTGEDDQSEVFITSYFEPVLQGSRTKTKKFSQALYATPLALIERQKRRLASAGEPGTFTAHGPYLSRREIDQGRALKGQKLELAYVDPIDAFVLQIQGSGVVRFADGGELRLGYAAQNGHAYVAIGKFLLDVIPKEKMSLQAIEEHLRSMPPERMFEILYANPSYVFFQPLLGRGLTYFGTEVVEGRTIATDRKHFPKGSLALLEFDRPTFDGPNEREPSDWQRSTRFVLDQDTGGAIKGPERLDLFWGQGAGAKQAAGVIKGTGRLHYFVPKPELLAKTAHLRPQPQVMRTASPQDARWEEQLAASSDTNFTAID